MENIENGDLGTYPINLLKRRHEGEPSSTPEITNDEREIHSAEKRHKAADWPLRNDVDILPQNHIESSRSPARSPSSLPKRKGKKSLRPSRFKEGSLNDKPSKEPPPSYIGEELAMEAYAKSQDPGEAVTHKIYNTLVEPTKPSSMFRFGKAIANAFNPVTMWQGINGIWKDKDQSTFEVREKLGDDREEIRKAYIALKEGGFQGVKTTNAQRHSADAQQMTSEAHPDWNRNSFRDSAIDIDQPQDSHPPQDTNTSSHLIVPRHKRERTSISPFSESSSGRRSFTQLRPPSFQDMKRVTSNIQLPSARRRSSAAPVLPSTKTTNENGAREVETGSGLRRVPSKKDIARYNRLNKRVSDLETKLEAARQELKQSLLAAPPVPDLPSSTGQKQFVPGALDSLPSERLLNQHIQRNVVDKSEMKTTASEQHSDLALAGQVSHPDAKPTTGVQSWRDVEPDDIKKTSSGEAQCSLPKGLRHNPKQIQEAKAPISAANTKKGPLPNLPALTPYNSPVHAKEAEAEDIPPLPAPPLLLDLRSESFPTLQPSNKGNLNPISVQHANHPRSPFLGPPQVISPMQTRSRAKKRGISPPPPSLASAKKAKGLEAKGDGVESLVVGRKGVGKEGNEKRKVEGEEKEILRSKTQGSSKRGTEKTKLAVDKPLPDIQKEDFEWDEDVF